MTPTITNLKPGDNVMYCESIAAPDEAERQIVNPKGYGSAGRAPRGALCHVGNRGRRHGRPCTTRDMLTVTFVGAVGSEGVSAAKLPDGMAFTVPKGFALMTNTHYINSTDKVMEGQSVVT